MTLHICGIKSLHLEANRCGVEILEPQRQLLAEVGQREAAALGIAVLWPELHEGVAWVHDACSLVEGEGLLVAKDTHV